MKQEKDDNWGIYEDMTEMKNGCLMKRTTRKKGFKQNNEKEERMTWEVYSFWTERCDEWIKKRRKRWSKRC